MTLVLVVEDEAMIRMGAVLMLEDAGFTVLEASNADVAIRMLEYRKDISAVFTDILMPGSLSGLRLVCLIRERWPPIHLIVASGLKPPAEEEFPAMGRFVRKPYTPQDVLEAFEDLCGENPAPYRHVDDVIQNYSRVI